MSGITLEIIFIFVLLLANGVFAMAEISLVASRKAKLKTLADEGHHGAKLAHNLALAPGKFLSTVQVGITLVGTLAGAFGGAGIAQKLEVYVANIPGLGTESSHYISLFIVVAIITYFSVIIGELVPKRLALSNPEKIASALARPMNALANSCSPLVNLLSHSSDFLMALIGVRKTKETAVSEEEVRVLIDEGLSTGVFKKAEKDMVEGVFELDEQHAGDLMTPRARMIWLSLDDTDDENWRRIAGSGHSHFPVYQETRDNVIGMVSVKSLWANLSLAGRVELRALVTPPLYVPTAMPAGRLIESFKKSGKHIALVVDEFGGLQGLVTLNDVMMAMIPRPPCARMEHGLSTPCSISTRPNRASESRRISPEKMKTASRRSAGLFCSASATSPAKARSSCGTGSSSRSSTWTASASTRSSSYRASQKNRSRKTRIPRTRSEPVAWASCPCLAGL